MIRKMHIRQCPMCTLCPVLVWYSFSYGTPSVPYFKFVAPLLGRHFKYISH